MSPPPPRPPFCLRPPRDHFCSRNLHRRQQQLPLPRLILLPLSGQRNQFVPCGMIKDGGGLMHLFCRECASALLPLCHALCFPRPPHAKADHKFQLGDIVASNLIVVRLVDRGTEEWEGRGRNCSSKKIPTRPGRFWGLGDRNFLVVPS